MTQETPVNPPETIEKAKLEALVEDMREVQGIANYKGNEEREQAFKECADVLEEVLEE